MTSPNAMSYSGSVDSDGERALPRVMECKTQSIEVVAEAVNAYLGELVSDFMRVRSLAWWDWIWQASQHSTGI